MLNKISGSGHRLSVKVCSTSVGGRGPIIDVGRRLKQTTSGDTYIQLKVWSDVKFQEIVDCASKMHTVEGIPFRDAVHHFVDTLLDVEFLADIIDDGKQCDMCMTSFDESPSQN